MSVFHAVARHYTTKSSAQVNTSMVERDIYDNAWNVNSYQRATIKGKL